MTTERLRATDYRFVAVCLALLTACTWFSVRNFHRAFPEASIDFRVNRDQGQTLASGFLSANGYRTQGYREASSFGFDDDTKTFLEREVGLERANRIMGSRVRLWNWSYRWFRPLQKEEYRVSLTPKGEIVGFAHELAEDTARPEASSAQARSLAEEFLRERMHRDPASLDFVEVSENARPRRTDRVFTWKERDFNVRDATYRLEVTLLGNEVGGYREYLKIPEQWSRDYQRLRSKNEMAQLVDTVLMLGLVIGLLVVIALRLRGHDVRWQRAAVIGVIGMALTFLSQLNQFSVAEFQYPTTDSYSSFVARVLLQGIINALASGGLLFVLAAGAEPLYREAFRDRISLGNLFRLRALGTKRFFLGAILGITLTAIFVAYQTGFYIVAFRFGAWSPADVPYDDLLNTRFPWLFVLIGGYLPAVSEEFLFRMFGIPFLRKLVRSTALAIILAGFIWGFGHAGYPQQPFFIRGVEVGIGGVALGLIFLRWGILPALVWHYSVDAMYSAMLLIRSQSLYYRFSGVVAAGAIVLPVIVALVAYMRRGGFVPETGLLNADEESAAPPPQEPAPAPAEPQTGYVPLTARVRFAAMAIFAAGLLALLIPVTRFGAAPKFRLTGEQARAAADAFVRAQGINPGAFRHVTFPETHQAEDSLTAKYFFERRPVSFANAMFARHRPLRFWVTRYFRSLDKEEVAVAVHPETGKILGYAHELPEDRPGADLTPDAARAVAASFAAARGWDLAAMDLKESSSERKKARRDYALEWEPRAGDPRNLDETKYRLHIEVSGDRVTAFRAYWKVPEAYSRARSRQNFISLFTLIMRLVVTASGIVLGILLLVQCVRKGTVPWGAALRVALPVTALTALGSALALKLVMQNYDTAVPLETFQATAYLGIGIVTLFGGVLMASAAALIGSYFPDALSSLRTVGRRSVGVDAVVAAMAGAGLFLLLGQFRAVLQDRLHAVALPSIQLPDLIANSAPALAAIAGAAESMVLRSAFLCVVVLVLAHLPRRWMLWPFAAAAVFISVSPGVHAPAEFALQYGIAAAAAAAVVTFCRWFGRRNYLAYALAFWIFGFRGALEELSHRPVQLSIVALVLAATVVWTVLPALAKKAGAAAAART
jgi:membrane protease YdiL (CAAX protease family)